MINIYLTLHSLRWWATSLLAAVPTQESLLGELPWWIWLVATSVLLLILFIVIVAFDWGSSTNVIDDEE